MNIEISEVGHYLSENVIDIEDWESYDDQKKKRILNAAYSTLIQEYPKYVIPNEAVFEFVGVLAVLLNDVNKNQFYGVAGYSVTGVTSFTFANSSANTSYAKFIPASSKKLIGDANNINLDRPRVGRLI